MENSTVTLEVKAKLWGGRCRKERWTSEEVTPRSGHQLEVGGEERMRSVIFGF